MTLMPDGLMTVCAETYALAFDEPHGLYCLNEDNGIPWLSPPIAANSDIHWEVQYLLRDHGIKEHQEILLHSTSAEEPGAFPYEPDPPRPVFWSSWHPRHTSIIHTYMAVVEPATECVLDTWPNAKPLTVELFQTVGQPLPHGATQAPMPRDYDVLFQGLRHLNHLYQTDSINREALGPVFGEWIAPFPPVLAKMYHRQTPRMIP